MCHIIICKRIFKDTNCNQAVNVNNIIMFFFTKIVHISHIHKNRNFETIGERLTNCFCPLRLIKKKKEEGKKRNIL